MVAASTEATNISILLFSVVVFVVLSLLYIILIPLIYELANMKVYSTQDE